MRSSPRARSAPGRSERRSVADSSADPGPPWNRIGLTLVLFQVPYSTRVWCAAGS